MFNDIWSDEISIIQYLKVSGSSAGASIRIVWLYWYLMIYNVFKNIIKDKLFPIHLDILLSNIQCNYKLNIKSCNQ